MLLSDLAFYLPADQEMLVIYPQKGPDKNWTSIRFQGTSEQFLESCGDDGGDVVSIDVVNDGDTVVVVAIHYDEEDETDE